MLVSDFRASVCIFAVVHLHLRVPSEENTFHFVRRSIFLLSKNNCLIKENIRSLQLCVTQMSGKLAAASLSVKCRVHEDIPVLYTDKHTEGVAEKNKLDFVLCCALTFEPSDIDIP
jgi:hypothetical protein